MADQQRSELSDDYYENMNNVGIPTPPEYENVGPFDTLNEWVEDIVDAVEHDLALDEHSASTHDVDATDRDM